MIQKYDFLVIGSGIAGLSFALKVAEKGKVGLIAKTDLDETNTKYAQGGIAAVMYPPDNYEKHVRDTMIAGDGLCDREVVEMVAREAPSQINQLINWGVKFDKGENGKYDLGREGGHSECRVFHHKDNTGEEIEQKLVRQVRNHQNIEIMENYFAVEVLTQHHLGKTIRRNDPDIECYGAYVMDMNTSMVYKVLSKVTVIATGGVGQLYATTTNPHIATGDGIAMVYRAKGIIENMEFVQFHPTSLYNPGESPSFLITEAMRGYGGILRNHKGEDFMQRYDERGSLAPRDIVARAIDNELKTSGDDYLYLDATHLDETDLKKQFPNIHEKC